MSNNQSPDRLDPATRDTAFDASLRPTTFSEFVGQEGICQRLKAMVQAAQERGDVIDHILLSGPPGLGKTTLAHMLAHAMGVNITSTNGIEKAGDLAGLLTIMERGDVLFIEEIDLLAPDIAEYLYPAMENYQLDIIIDQGPNARSIPLNLPRFTLIGATTREDLISARLRSRFGTNGRLDSYTVEELQRIVLRSAGILDVPIDPHGALEIATRAQGTPRIANTLLRLAASHLRLKSAISHSDWCELLDVLTRELWSLAEARPDFEELPSWVAEVRASGAPVEDANQAAAGIEQIHTVLRSVVDRYGDGEDRAGFARMRSIRGGPGDMALAVADLTQKAATFRKGVRRLPLAIKNDQLAIGRHTRLSFNRTLRIPEDGREYSLPAGFGRLPILRVEDYAKRVPEQWLEQGGFIIPLYQREALFLEFAGVQWRPTIGKVSVGRVNAISGKEHDLKIRPHRQDYVVIPDQRWLDGINSGSGSVSQFVAMPLGKGYTIEAQVTDEEKFGGFQLAVFDPRAGRFPEQDPKENEAALAARKQRAFWAAQQELLNDLPLITTRVIRAVQKQHYADAAKALGMSEKEILQKIEGARQQLEDVLGANGFAGVSPEAHLRARRDVSGPRFMPEEAKSPRAQFMPETGDSMPSGRRSASKPVVEMGIARGGKIKQQIMEDTYGAESWDEAAFREVVIHIVNSEVYQHITGREAPPSPITDEQYRSCKIPWYSDYKEKAPSLSPVAVFKRVLSIGQIDKNRGVAKDEAPPRREIQPEEILRIRTPTLEDRWKALLDRAVESSKGGHHRIAAREASLALDLSDKHPLPFFIRALSNHRLGHHSDAEADASACLKLQPDNIGALSIRAYSSLELGDTLIAKNDAEMILASQPDDHDGLYVRAEANLRLAHYKEALGDAEKILRKNPANRMVLRIRKAAMTKLFEARPQLQGPTTSGVTTDKRPANWQEIVMQQHPDIGVKDSPANKAFIAAHKAATQQGQEGVPYDPAQHGSALADKIIAPLYASGQATPAGGRKLVSDPSPPKQQRHFKTLEQQLIETDHSVWGDQTMKAPPIWIAAREAAERALTDQTQSVLFFQHYLTFLREASVLEIPLEGGWDSEWLALIFESAFGFANANPGRAEELMSKVGSERGCVQQIVGALNRAVLRWPAHDYVRRVVDDRKPEDYREIVDNGGGIKWLLESAESFFWAGIHTATEARKDPEALELIEFFDISGMRRWGDSRLHINLLRSTPLRCDASLRETFDHPLLRIAAEKYRNNPVEGEIIGDFLEELCMKQGIKSEREGLDRDLFVCELVREGRRFGERLLENESNTFAKMLETANGYAGDSLLAFYARILAKVEDRTDPLLITRAFLDWQAEQRDEVSPRYSGERLETLLNCIDAAIYLPWAEATKNK